MEIMAEKNQQINGLIDSSMEKLENIADVNTIIGKPIITASRFQIISFSKVTLGNLTGGGEYGDAKVIKEMDGIPFAGGSGAVVSMKPMGFLIDDGVSCRILRITDQPLDNLVERAGEIVHDLMSKE
jgi:sporulation protein YtfJ